MFLRDVPNFDNLKGKKMGDRCKVVGHTYSKQMGQPYPRKCIRCNNLEGEAPPMPPCKPAKKEERIINEVKEVAGTIVACCNDNTFWYYEKLIWNKFPNIPQYGETPMLCPECQEVECDEDCSNPREK